VVAISAGAGGEAGQLAVDAGEFTIGSDTNRVDITAGTSADVSIHIERDASNDAAIELTVTGLPAGVTVSAATVAAADDSATLTFSASNAAVPATSVSVQVHGTDGVTMKTLLLPLFVRGKAGTLDETFGVKGVAAWNGSDHDFNDGRMAVLPDGHIVVGGSFKGPSSGELGVLRFKADGTLDATFGKAGAVRRAPGPTLAIGDAFGIRPDGTIVVAGYSVNIQGNVLTYAAIQLQVTANGASYPGFGTDGLRSYAKVFGFEDLNFENGQTIAVGGRDFDAGTGVGVVSKLDADGNVDPSFGSAGLLSWSAINGEIWRVINDGDGYLALASSSDKPCILRFDKSGKAVSGWGMAGVLPFTTATARLYDAAINAKGQYIIVGDSGTDDWLLSRVTPAGQILTVTDSFTTGDDNATHLLISGDSYYVIGTEKKPLATPNVYAPILVRYDAAFQRDAGFGKAGIYEFDQETTYVGTVGVAQQLDGRLIVATTVRGAGTVKLYRLWN
jgi:uncharacterized delta-60 repeat protein